MIRRQWPPRRVGRRRSPPAAADWPDASLSTALFAAGSRRVFDRSINEAQREGVEAQHVARVQALGDQCVDVQLAEGDERPAQAILVHGIRRVSREQILGDDACLGRPAGRQVRVGEPRLGVSRFLLQPGIDADVHEPEQRGQMVGKRVGKAPICGNGAECVAARELSVRGRLNVHERQFRVGDTKPLFDQGLRAVRLACEQAGEEPAGGRQVTGPGAQFSGGGKQVAVVHLAGPVQVSTRGGQIAAVRTRTRKAGEQRQVVWRDTAGVGEHRHLAFGIPVRGARVGQRDQLRGGRRHAIERG